jgi:hypothetical protein
MNTAITRAFTRLVRAAALALAVLAAATLAVTPAHAQSLSASPASLYSGHALTAAWDSIAAPTATDWIGLFPTGAADTAFIAWIYTDGNATGSGPFTVPATAPAGTYELRLFANNSSTKLATSNTVTVQGPPPANLAASPSTVFVGGAITAAWDSILAPTATDWVGLYAAGAADNAFIAWVYTNGNAAGNVPLTVPVGTPTGSYELRLFYNNGYAKLATSNGVTVQPQPAAALSVSPTTVYSGHAVTATWGSIFAPTATDWIGLFATRTRWPGRQTGAVDCWMVRVVPSSKRTVTS